MPPAANGQGPVTLRKMTPEDIPLGMELKSKAGWNQLESDWKMLLEAGGDNFVASLEGQDVGTVISIPYPGPFTWISMVLVDPKAKRKGVGRTLLNRSIELASAKGAIRLDATSEGYELYKNLGFQTEYELARMVRRSSGPRAGKQADPGSRVRQLTENDLAEVFNMDRPIFGADRSRFLLSLYRRNPEYAFCIKEKDALEAYCLGRSGSQFEQIGPIVAEDSTLAADLLMAVLRHLESRAVVLDAFGDKPDCTTFLEGSGFTRERILTRMCLGCLDHPGIPEKQFAITGPEIG